MSAEERIRRLQILQHAEGYLELGMASQALAVLSSLQGSARRDGHTLYLRGEALRALDRHGEAIKAFRKAAEILPDNLPLWLAMGWCYKRIGKLDQAIDALESAMAVEPSEAIVYYNLACYWSLAHNKAHALEYLSQAFEIDSSYRDLVHSEPDFDPMRSDPDFQTLTSLIA